MTHTPAGSDPSTPATPPTPADVAAAPRPAPPRPTAPTSSAPVEPPAAAGAAADGAEFGRVADDGDVFVTIDGDEVKIGSWQVGAPAEALDFFTRKFADLVVQVDLLEKRLHAGSASPEDTAQGVAKVREAIATPHAIGDFATLRARLSGLEAGVAERREQRRAERGQAQEQARERKEQITTEAETIAAGEDWRAGADRLRVLLDEWKALPRADRRTDDALWRRFSSARTHYTRHRRAHFAAQANLRDQAQVTKEKLITRAEALSPSTDWAGTAREYRDLMSQWKAAGPAPRTVEETLWRRFRSAQDAFFDARTAAMAERDQEHQANLQAKHQLLAEAEALLPVTDWKAARESLRGIQDRWETVGHVPRDAIRTVEGRLSAVEDAVRDAQDDEWRQTNPEARARAQATVDQLEGSISSLRKDAERLRAAGNERKALEAENALTARESWLAQARAALAEFGG